MSHRVFIACILSITSFFYSANQRVFAQTSDQVQFQVTGNVNTRPDQIQLELTSNDTANGATIAQEQTSSFSVLLTSTSTLSTIATIRVSYAALSPDGSGQFLLDYVPGSATPLSGATAVINQQERTITWQNVTIPANTNHITGSFQLKSNSRFTDTTVDVPLTISAALTHPFITPSRQFSLRYRYNLTLVPPTPTPTPTPLPQQLAIKSVLPTTSVREMILTELRSRATTIEVAASENSTLRLKYGTSAQQLNKTINSFSQSGLHRFRITDLKPATTYYFQLQSPRPDGFYASLDTYVFRTPTKEEAFELNQLYQLTGRNSQGMIFSGKLFSTKEQPPIIVLPRSSTLVFDLRYDPAITLDQTQILLESQTWKKYATDTPIAAQSSVLPSSTAADTVSKFLQLPENLGEFTLKTRLKTQQGSISEATLANIQIIKPIIIRRQRNGAPISDVKVTIHKYNQDTGSFQPYPDPNQSPLELYSNPDGSIDFIPQAGRFRFHVSRAPFYSKVADLRIELSPTMVLPDIELRSTVATWLEPISYLMNDIVFGGDTKKSSFQEWINEWSEIIIGKTIFPIDTQELVTTQSF